MKSCLFLLVSTVSFLFSSNCFAKVKKAAEADLSACSEKLRFGSCEKIESLCNNGDSRACASIAIYWQRQGDSEKMMAYVQVACEHGDMQACKTYGSLRSGNIESVRNNERIAELNTQRVELERQQNARVLSGALMQMSNQMQQPQQPKSIKCKTLKKPGNGMDGAEAYYSTECK